MIPKTFSLVNRRWKVVLCKDWKGFIKELKNHQVPAAAVEGIDEDSLAGMCLVGPSEILLVKTSATSEFQLEHCYFHELAHALMFANGKTEEPHDEDEVERLGSHLHQYELTKRGEHWTTYE